MWWQAFTDPIDPQTVDRTGDRSGALDVARLMGWAAGRRGLGNRAGKALLRV